MSDMIEIKISVSTYKIGSEVERIVEIEKDYWEELDSAQRDTLMYEVMQDEMMFSWDYEEV